MTKFKPLMGRFSLVAVLIILFGAIPVKSEIPRTILYQGILTDSIGLSVPDGTYFIRFRIWSDSTGTDIGFEKWNSNIQPYDVTGGLLEVRLGQSPMPALPDNIFKTDTNLYLGMTVGAASELTPRIKFAAVPYAYKALIADTANLAISVAPNSITGDAVVDSSIGLIKLSREGAQSGDVISWDGSQWIPSAVSGGSSNITTIVAGTGLAGGGDSGSVAIYVPPGGIMGVHIAPNAVSTFEIAPNSIGSSHILPSGVTQSDLAVSSIGTSEVIDNSLFNVDIVDEPGLVQSRNVDTVLLSNLAMTDLVTLTITTPYTGFIFLTGRANLRFYGATNSSIGLVQIDESSGGAESAGHFSSVGLSTYPTTGDYKFNCTSQRVYFKSAGTHTFRLESKKLISVAQSQIEASSAILTAIFFTTSYGNVQPIEENIVQPETE